MKQQQQLPRTLELSDITIGTWNVRSLYRTGALTTTISCLERYKLDITAIQEVRWEDSGSITSQRMTMFYSGGTKHKRGVGFIVKDKILPNIVNFK
jgi:exonuclease III